MLRWHLNRGRDAPGEALPGGRIVDEPRFAYRGAMLDIARHFFTVDEIKDKATVTIPSPRRGKVVRTVGAEGDIAKVHATLVVLELAHPEDESKRCDLLLALGQASAASGERDRLGSVRRRLHSR